jgi:uncharacterized membrane protein
MRESDSLDQYDGTVEKSSPFQLGQWARGKVLPKLGPYYNMFTKGDQYGYLSPMVNGAIIGASLGTLSGVKKKKKNIGSSALWGAGLGGLAGTALAWGLEKGLQKKSNYGMGSNDESEILRKLYDDTSLNMTQKQALANEVSRLDAQSKSRLSQLLYTLAGGSVGVVVAKYLLGMGKFSTILTALAAAAVGAMVGQPGDTKPTHDQFGNQYYI